MRAWHVPHRATHVIAQVSAAQTRIRRNSPWPSPGTYLVTCISFSLTTPCLRTAKSSGYVMCAVGLKSRKKISKWTDDNKEFTIGSKYRRIILECGWERRRQEIQLIGRPDVSPSGNVFSLWESRAFPGQGRYVALPVRLAPTPGLSHQSKALAGPRGGIKIRRSEALSDGWLLERLDFELLPSEPRLFTQVRHATRPPPLTA